jgi:hypothetical protein
MVDHNAVHDFTVIDRSAICQLIQELHEGRIFSVTFVKRSTGETRVVQCRKGVTKHLKGGPAAYNPAHHNLLWVYSMDAKGYRSIAIEGIESLKMEGVTYIPQDTP